MPEIAEAPVAIAEVPVAESLTPKGVSEDLMLRKLSPEQQKEFRAIRKEKKAKEAPAAETEQAKAPQAKPAPESKVESKIEEPTGDVIRFGEEENPAAEATPTEESAPVELTEEELARLTDKQRKAVTEASKEAAKVRKRAQEAEAKLTERDDKLAEASKTVADLTAQMTDWQARGVALAGNSFHSFKDAHAVAQWGTNAQEALVLISNHERAIKAGRATADDNIVHTLPNGTEITLSPEDRHAYESRVRDAQAWFTHDDSLTKNREAAKKLSDKYSATAGYAAARDKYFKDPALSTRLEELVAKAALFDTLESRKATITFPDTAGAAKSAPSTPAGVVQQKPAKQPPSESPASTPRLVKTDDADSDIAARKSALMERARTSDDPALRQRFLKEAIMLGNPGRTKGK